MERTLNRRYFQSEYNLFEHCFEHTFSRSWIQTTNTYNKHVRKSKKYLLFILMDMDELVTLKLVWSNTQNISPTSL